MSGALVSTLDLLPTFAGLAGATPPTDREYDGFDLVPLLFASAEDDDHDGAVAPAASASAKAVAFFRDERVLYHIGAIGQVSAPPLPPDPVRVRGACRCAARRGMG